MSENSDDEQDVCRTDMNDETSSQDSKETAGRPFCGDPRLASFSRAGRAGGRPKGAKDKLNRAGDHDAGALWTKRGDEIIDQLAAEKPEVVAGLIARLIPQSAGNTGHHW